MGSLGDREVVSPASDRQGSIFESSGVDIAFQWGGGLKFDKIFHYKAVEGPAPRGIFLLQRLSRAIKGILGTVSHSVYHQILRKPLNKVMIFFLSGPTPLLGSATDPGSVLSPEVKLGKIVLRKKKKHLKADI